MSTPPNPGGADPASAGEPESIAEAERRNPWPAWVIAILAFLSYASFPGFVLRAPFGFVLVNVAIVWGTVEYFHFRLPTARAVRVDAMVAALFPLLTLPFLVRWTLGREGVSLPTFLDGTILPLVILLIMGLETLRVLRRDPVRFPSVPAARIVGFSGAGVAAGLVLAGMAAAASSRPAGPFLFAFAAVLVSVAVGAQWLAGRASPGRLRFLAAGGALCVAAAQLFDGVVSYLSVKDPLGLAPGEFHEQIAVSAWLLHHTGFGYPLLKWALALVIAYFLERPGDGSRRRNRIGIYLVLGYVSVGPALYSGTQLL